MTETKREKLGKYEIIEEMGRGGFSVVYKALDTSLHSRPVALKVLHPHLLVDPTSVQRFQHEAGAAANLRHPNIVVVHEVGEVEEVYYIAMEYLPGTALDDLVKEQGPFPLKRAVRITKQIASALDYAHAEGFIHRDVKSGNIIVGEDDHATLTDFGLVRAAEDTMLTSTGRILGTPEYMSPEQAQGQEIDYRTDLYSLGVVAYEILTGRVPFKGETPSATHYMHVHEKPPKPTQINSTLAEEVGDVLLKALTKDKEARYQSGRELAEELEDAVAPREPEKKGKGEGQEGRRLSAGWIAAGVLALMLTVVAGGVLFSGRGIPSAVAPTETPAVTIYQAATWTHMPAVLPTGTSTATPTARVTSTPTATPSATPQPTNTPTSATTIPTVTTSPPPRAAGTPTNTPASPAALPYPYPAPVPVNRRPSGWTGGPTFSWTWSGVLRHDEYFDVRVWPSRHPSEPVDGQWMITCAPLDDFSSHASVAWTKDTQFTYVPPDWVSDTLFCWSVAVVRGQNGTLLAQLSPESDLCDFR